MAIPGLARIDHIGFTVPDLDEATTWLVDVLGCELMYSLGPFRSEDGDWMLEHMNVHPRAVMRPGDRRSLSGRRGYDGG